MASAHLSLRTAPRSCARLQQSTMDRLSLFGLFAVATMLITYALERRSTWFILAFAVACGLGSAYGFCKVPGHSGWSRRSGRWSPCGAGTLRAAPDRPLARPAGRDLPRLYRRARRRAVGAINATVAGLWAQRLTASTAFMGNDAVILRHNFWLFHSTVWTSDRRFQRHCTTLRHRDIRAAQVRCQRAG